MIVGCAVGSIAGCGGATEQLTKVVEKQNAALEESYKQRSDLETRVAVLTRERDGLSSELAGSRHALESARRELEESRAKRLRGQLVTELSPAQVQMLTQTVTQQSEVKRDAVIARLSESVILLKYRSKHSVLSAHIITDQPLELEVINLWNRGTFFSRLYRGKDNRLIFESELDLKVGVPLEYLQQWFQRLKGSVERLEKFLNVAKRGGRGERERRSPRAQPRPSERI